MCLFCYLLNFSTEISGCEASRPQDGASRQGSYWILGIRDALPEKNIYSLFYKRKGTLTIKVPFMTFLAMKRELIIIMISEIHNRPFGALP